MVIPKYQLAEHRYGREEMLALFDKSVFAPEPLRSISGLYVEKIQLPLALIQMSEEETVRMVRNADQSFFSFIFPVLSFSSYRRQSV